MDDQELGGGPECGSALESGPGPAISPRASGRRVGRRPCSGPCGRRASRQSSTTPCASRALNRDGRHDGPSLRSSRPPARTGAPAPGRIKNPAEPYGLSTGAWFASMKCCVNPIDPRRSRSRSSFRSRRTGPRPGLSCIKTCIASRPGFSHVGSGAVRMRQEHSKIEPIDRAGRAVVVVAIVSAAWLTPARGQNRGISALARDSTTA